MSDPWVGVDLDRTLAHFDVWRGPDHIGPPILPMLERVFRWLAEGRTVKIFTARITHPDARPETIPAIQDWCESYGLPRLEVTATKDHNCVAIYDDIAVHVVANTGQVLPEIL